jgi:hypothetical protein
MRSDKQNKTGIPSRRKGRTSQPPSTPQTPYGLGEFQSLLLRKNLAETLSRRDRFLVAEKGRTGSPPSTPQTAYYSGLGEFWGPFCKRKINQNFISPKSVFDNRIILLALFSRLWRDQFNETVLPARDL